MADSSVNPIPPVENLQNIVGLTPTGQRQERRRRKNPARPDREAEEVPAETLDEEGPDEENTCEDSNPHKIDYCA